MNTMVNKLFLLSIGLSLMLNLNACRTLNEADQKPKPVLEKGVIDLRNWDPEKDGSVELTGDWKFYWNQFLLHEAVTSEKQEHTYVRSPGFWNDVEQKGDKIGAFGFATYRATVLIGKNEAPLALKFRDIYSAYAVYVDKTLIGTVGSVADRADQVEGVNRPTMMNFAMDEEKFDILIHVANSEFLYGGIPSPPKIGLAEHIRSERENNIAFEMFITGVIFFIGVYHLLLFVLRRKESLYLYFSIHCFGIVAYGAITGECFLLQLMHLNSFDAVLKIALISTSLAFLFLMLFIQAIFERILPKPLLWLQISLFVTLAITGMVLPLEWVQFIHIGNQLLVTASLLGSLAIIIIAVKRKYEDAWLILTGFVFLLFTVFNDIAHYHSLIDTQYLISFGLLVLCVSESIFLSMRMSSAFFKVETLSISLDKSNKRLQKLDQLKNDFLARTSHELKTPLNGIIGTTEVLLEKSGHLLPEEDLASLAAVVSNSSRLTLLINDILDYSKLQKKEIALYRSAVDIAACSRLVIDLLKPLCDRKKQNLHNHLAEGLPLVYADDSRLQQILHNLLGNAIKFTPEGGTIELRAIKQGTHLSTTVQDSGCGIPESEFENVFIPFEQIEAVNGLKKTGTGLGLSITKTLVELHGGSITINSTEGKGTQIEFSLPLFPQSKINGPADDNMPISPVDPVIPKTIYAHNDDIYHSRVLAKETETDSSNPCILIVDDEPVNLTVLNSQLTMAGYNTVLASSGIEALGAIEENDIDLVLLDYMMTDLNGFEVLKKIRELENNPTSFPVIMITAFFHSDTAAKCFQQGANDYLYKPVKKEDLLMRVKNQLDIKEKAELSERLKTYKKIDFDLRRLRKIEQVINLLEEKIIIAQHDKTIVFCNKPATEYLGYSPRELHGKKLNSIIAKESVSKLWKNASRLESVHRLENTLLESRVVVHKKNGEQVRSSVSISQFESQEGPELILIVKSVQGAELDQSIKELAVALMNNCLLLWETYTGKTKLQLAQESDIWTVSYDSQKGQYKAQTMEKYLKLKSFPAKRPRINAIANTVLFVLNQPEVPTEKKEKLKELLDQFSDAKQAIP